MNLCSHLKISIDGVDREWLVGPFRHVDFPCLLHDWPRTHDQERRITSARAAEVRVHGIVDAGDRSCLVMWSLLARNGDMYANPPTYWHHVWPHAVSLYATNSTVVVASLKRRL
jgi:hypothetical protein